MSKTFFFYDLETSGLNPRDSRIMQFAGQRTDLELNKIGNPVNLMVRMTDDTLPSPEALMVTGITPQQTIESGYSEAEFARMLINEIFIPDTIVVGYNNIRFDDEFIRHLLWRNFFDPYEWSYKDGRSRWDILDIVRMTRALRPEGINWPVDPKSGVAINTLESIAKENGVDHLKAHDAMSDVEALIGVAKIIHEKQPQLFDYLLRMRDKNEVKKLVNLDNKQPFVYASGRYDSSYNKTTVAFPLTSGKNGNIIVYDLRYDPTPFLKMSSGDLAKKIFAKWEERQADGFVPIPVKDLQYNRAPAVAPVGVLTQNDGWQKIALDEATISKHRDLLVANPTFAENIRSIFENREEYKKSSDPEAQLYDSFVPDTDKIRIEAVRNASERDLADFHPNFIDERLVGLLLHYKARNFPKSLAEEEVTVWENWRISHINAQLESFGQSMQKLARSGLDDDKAFILQELQLWAESILPAEF
ncbi:exodeoxyribonuclease I [Candidatus Saccharibacteria bacterium]|nr:exodeoxyribonuclease I [Candidatus Saccharibacteria bacterium]